MIGTHIKTWLVARQARWVLEAIVSLPLRQKNEAPLSGRFAFLADDDGLRDSVRRIRSQRTRTAAGWPSSAVHEEVGLTMSQTIRPVGDCDGQS
jgi:hypothetical protein